VYDVVLDTTIQIKDPESILPLITSDFPEFTVTADAVTVTPRHPQARRQSLQTVGTITFIGCTQARQNIINAALAIADSMLARDNTYLTNPCASLPVAKTYFGVCNAARFANITLFFGKERTLLDTGIQVDCSTCNKTGTYAYVYPDDTTHTVYLCSVFWTANTSECAVDSQAGTFIHEMSHFDDTAANQDWVYGQPGAIALAKSNPAHASNNADNYEYFSEACPVAPTFGSGYQGCYTDKSASRDMTGAPFENKPSMTIEMCHEYCAASGTTYYGLQSGTYCFCDNTYGSYGSVADGNCLLPCGGNNTEACGGSLRNAVYSVAGSDPLVPPNGPSGYIGCYKDVAASRALNGNKTSKAPMTVDSCLTFCTSSTQSQSWLYYGVQQTVCYCGNSYATYGPGAGCSTTCAGDATEICGGSLRNSVYATS